MVALTTQLLDAKLKLAEAAKGTGSDGGGKITGGGTKTNGPEEWQFGKVGNMKQMYNTTWWWYSKHNNCKGMYVRHPPTGYDTWRQKKKAGKPYITPNYCSSTTPSGGDTKPNGSNSANAKPSSATSHLELGSELKQVCTCTACPTLMLTLFGSSPLLAQQPRRPKDNVSPSGHILQEHLQP